MADPSEVPNPPPPLSAEVFDQAFRRAAESQWLPRVLGADLPPEVEPFSFVTLDALQDTARLLADCRHGTAVDLACGRGGPGLWLAQHIGGRQVSVDFSPVGIEHAKLRAQRLAPGIEIRYVVADVTAIPLAGDSVDGLFCIDSLQLFNDRLAGLTEVSRILKAGALAVFTTWEQPNRLTDLAALLAQAGLVVVTVEERPAWLARERAIFEQALADAPRFPDDAGLQGLAEEAKVVLPLQTRRVMGVAQKR